MNNKQKIYFFSQLQTDGDQNMVDILGGKGANIAEMCKLGLPVPPGFTLATSLCSDYLKNKTLSTNLKNNIKKNIAKTEGVIKKEFGGSNPLLLSVRSGAPVSMPGMMETILNIGLTSNLFCSNRHLYTRIYIHTHTHSPCSVSYTHLTLPTNREV